MLWHENNKFVVEKNDRVVVKLRTDDDVENKKSVFLKSIIIPTAMYPLNGQYEVFTYRNTLPVTDEKVLEIFDSAAYDRGRCYTNIKVLTQMLLENGYDAKSYVGWLFVSGSTLPIHHCWCVLNGHSVLDLADDFTQMRHFEKENYCEETSSGNDARMRFIEFAKYIKKHHIPNHERCFPVGTPTDYLFYVGAECDCDDGLLMYRNLMYTYPNHECQRNCDSNGFNATQKLFREAGLMDWSK